MIRFLFRALGFVLIAAAFAALVVDGTRSIAGQRILQFPLGDTAAWLGGQRYGAFLKTVADWPMPAPALIGWLLTVPTWIVTGAAGLGLSVVGRSRRRGAIGSSRP